MKNHSEYIEKAEAKLIDRGFITSDITNFYKEIFKWQIKYYNIFKETEAKIDFLNSSEPVIVDLDKISFPETIQKILNDSLPELCTVITEHQAGMRLDAFLLPGAGDKAADFAKLLLTREVEKLEACAKEKKIGTDEFIFIILNWLKPLFVYLSEENMAGVNMTQWLSAACPFCGYYPDIAKLDASSDGKRFLHCAFCENEWPFERLACTICGNKDFKKLGYYVEEEETPYRIDYCEICNGYIKTYRIDETRDPENIDLTAENILTLYLDKLAMEKGLSRP